MRERDQLQARDPKRKKMILEYKSTTPSLSTSDIAVKAGCTLNYVSRVLKAEQLLQQRQQPHQAEVPEAGHGAQESCESWFQRIVDTNLLDLKAALRTSLRGNPQQIQRWTTKVEAPSRIRHITASELDANTFPYDLSSTDTAERKRGSDWLRHHFSGEKKSSQGFVIMDAHTGSDGKQSEALFKALPTLLDEPSYAKEFKPVRSCLADQTPLCVFTDSELWGTIVEPCAWQFLVHREFMEKEVQDFEVVRVCIKKNKTAVLDSRTAHAGSGWTGKPGCKRLYREHYYGFRTDLLEKKRDDPTKTDEFTTVYLCDADHFPIVCWAQLGKAGPIFAPVCAAAALTGLWTRELAS